MKSAFQEGIIELLNTKRIIINNHNSISLFKTFLSIDIIKINYYIDNSTE